jgi:hypothetical protein
MTAMLSGSKKTCKGWWCLYRKTVLGVPLRVEEGPAMYPVSIGISDPFCDRSRSHGVGVSVSCKEA